MSRSPSIGAALAVATWLLAAPCLRAQDNVLIVVADDLGVDMLPSYAEGLDLPQTPVLDGLAARGLSFRNCWSSPLCSPTRSTLQTGRLGHRTGLGHVIEGGGSELSLSELTLPEALGLASPGVWSMAAFGKWHLGAAGDAQHPNASGWPHFSGSLGNLPVPGTYFSWTKVTDGATSTSTVYATTDTVDEAIAWIASAPEPWLCYLAFNAPHGPFHAPPNNLIHGTLPDVDPREEPRPFYKASIEAMDTELGRLFESVTLNSGPTNIIFLGDNGTPGEVTTPPTQPNHAKLTVYEGGVNVPLILSGPAVQASGRWSGALVQTTDVFMTALELAGAQLPPAQRPEDSISLLPYAQGQPHPTPREFVYTERFRPNGAGPYHVRRRAVRSRRYKLIRTRSDAASDEFYDLYLDRYEEEDRLGPGSASLAPHEAAALQRLRTQLESISGV